MSRVLRFPFLAVAIATCGLWLCSWVVRTSSTGSDPDSAVRFVLSRLFGRTLRGRNHVREQHGGTVFYRHRQD